MPRMRMLALMLALTLPAAGATKLLVTVVDRKTGSPVTTLKAGDFTVTADKISRRVEACEFTTGRIDVVLLLESSLIGQSVSSLAPALIHELGENEQMAIVAYDSAADLVQDFTSSKELLRRALTRIKFGNSPRLLDALYATADEGFEGAAFRRVIVLLTTGVDGPSRVSERDVVAVARRNGVSIYPVYLMGYNRSLLERLARRTGGAPFNLRNVARDVEGSPARRIFQVMRGHYTLTLTGNLSLGENTKITVRGNKKLFASYLELN